MTSAMLRDVRLMRDREKRQELYRALDHCLEQIIRCHVSYRTCSRWYPEIEHELIPLLQISESLAALARPTPSREFKVKTRQLLLTLPMGDSPDPSSSPRR